MEYMSLGYKLLSVRIIRSRFCKQWILHFELLLMLQE